MEYIRRTYGVPAKRGMRVEFRPRPPGRAKVGTITGSAGSYLRIMVDGGACAGLYHPTYNLVYITPQGRHATTGQSVYDEVVGPYRDTKEDGDGRG